jgi:hypothetical protein
MKATIDNKAMNEELVSLKQDEGLHMKHMNAKKLSIAILVPLSVILIFLFLRQLNDPEKANRDTTAQIVRIDKRIRENSHLIRKLETHESRLKSIPISKDKYRITVLVEGKLVYVTVDEVELDELSNALALDYLLEKYHATKGELRSDDPAIWKRKLYEDAHQGESHLFKNELPAIQMRIAELNQENQELEAAIRNLLPQYGAIHVNR